MAVIKIDFPTSGAPTALTDYVKLLDNVSTNIKGVSPVPTDDLGLFGAPTIVSGSIFNAGGVLYLADSDTSIIGVYGLNKYIEMIPSGDTLVPTWTSTAPTYNYTVSHYESTSGNLVLDIYIESYGVSTISSKNFNGTNLNNDTPEGQLGALGLAIRENGITGLRFNGNLNTELALNASSYEIGGARVGGSVVATSMSTEYAVKVNVSSKISTTASYEALGFIDLRNVNTDYLKFAVTVSDNAGTGIVNDFKIVLGNKSPYGKAYNDADFIEIYGDSTNRTVTTIAPYTYNTGILNTSIYNYAIIFIDPSAAGNSLIIDEIKMHMQLTDNAETGYYQPPVIMGGVDIPGTTTITAGGLVLQ